jgi:RNA polymerase sigma-70 factor (ECF subfamily)
MTYVDDAYIIESSWRDPERFSVLFDRHAPYINRYLARRVGPQAAEDLAGETFCVAFGRRGSYDGAYRDARPWLYGIATNLVAGHRRAEATRLRTLAAVAPDPHLPDHSDRAVACAAARSIRTELVAALAAVPDADRDVLLLIAWEDLSYAEVSRALTIPIGTVRSRLHRARARLRDLLADVDYKEIVNDLPGQ